MMIIIFKCKMCGGIVQFQQGDSVGVCGFCGARQTLPRSDDERRTELYEQANYFRRNGQFDKGMAVCEQLLKEDSADAEAYWLRMLCRYGITYVKDSGSHTHSRVPMLKYPQTNTIFEDEDYASVLKYADEDRREVYTAEAGSIEETRKKTLEAMREAEAAAREEKRRRRIKRTLAGAGVLLAACCAGFLIVRDKVVIPNNKYQEAMRLIEKGDYEEGYDILAELGDYKDAAEQIQSSKFDRAAALMEDGDYDSAKLLLREIDGYHEDDIDALITESKYGRAAALMEDGDYAAASDMFLELGDYKDSREKLEEAQSGAFANADAGDVIVFGNYARQDIEWLVLDREGDRILVLSKYCLDAKKYNDTKAEVTWETCSLRAWLNDEFLNNAFSSEQQAMIPEVVIDNPDNPAYKASRGGNSTKDRVFLLSIVEVKKYLPTDADRRADATESAQQRGAWTLVSDPSVPYRCCWWMRSPGHHNDIGTYINYSGGLAGNLCDVDNNTKGVRPALWIDLGAAAADGAKRGGD